MRYNVGTSRSGNVSTCVDEVTKNFNSPKLILYFSPVDHFEEYTIAIHAKFPNAICMGASSKTCLCRQGADANQLMAVGIEDGIKVTAGFISDIDKYPIKSVENVERAIKALGTTRNTVCFELTTGLLDAEESVLSTLNSVLRPMNVPIFGGTAGDDAVVGCTKVALNGEVKERSTVFVMIHNENGAIHLFKENIYVPYNGNVMTATKVDYATRRVYSFDNMPAITAYAKQLGVSEAEATKYFDTHPIGRMVGDETFITANKSVQSDKSMFYHARIYENSQVMVLRPDDYRTVLENTMDRIKQECSRPSFAIVCNCLARTLLFEGEGFIQDFAKTIGSTVGDFVGFSGYGEQLQQHNFNQTMAVCVFE